MIIITGISSGIGKAIALDFLAQGESVIGIGRINTIRHPRLEFKECDLNDPKQIEALSFNLDEEESVTLINNAGILGIIGRLSEQESNDIQEVLTVNVIAPVLLTHKVLRLFPIDKLITIINISSGAGKRPIPSWANYCASKAALDLFSQTLLQEELERGRKIRVYSVAPGVVDTPMQHQIRSSNPSTFSAVQTFIDYKEQGALYSPELVANKLNNLLNQPYTNEVIVSLRDY